MEKIVANVDNITFNIESVLNVQEVVRPLMFVGMDKSIAPFCVRHFTGECQMADRCPYRHKQKDKTVLCTYYLKGLCKMGDNCNFLHEYDPDKMPECYFHKSKGGCDNKDCLYRHPEKKLIACPWYDRGFCRHGAACKNEHVRKVLCENYLCGFCMDGPNCQQFHPRFELPVGDPSTQNSIKCHNCGEMGHKAPSCPLKEANPANPMANRFGNNGKRRPLDQVTCYLCQQRGHYANNCPMRKVPARNGPT